MINLSDWDLAQYFSLNIFVQVFPPYSLTEYNFDQTSADAIPICAFIICTLSQSYAGAITTCALIHYNPILTEQNQLFLFLSSS
jgi:hypothetical protein